MSSAAERRERAKLVSQHLPPMPARYAWREQDLEAMRAAFSKRFNEELPRTETLLAVAAIGFRVALAELKIESDL